MNYDKIIDLANKLDDYQSRDIWYEAMFREDVTLERQVNNAQRAMRHAAEELRRLAEVEKTYTLIETILRELDPDGEILGNDIADEYRVRTGEVKRCVRCEGVVESHDAYYDDLHDCCVDEYVKRIKTPDDAEQFAIDWQTRFNERESVSYGELAEDQQRLKKLAERFNLTEVFVLTSRPRTRPRRLIYSTTLARSLTTAI